MDIIYAEYNILSILESGQADPGLFSMFDDYLRLVYENCQFINDRCLRFATVYGRRKRYPIGCEIQSEEYLQFRCNLAMYDIPNLGYFEH